MTLNNHLLRKSAFEYEIIYYQNKFVGIIYEISWKMATICQLETSVKKFL